MRPLAGITVVSVEHAVAAPFATRQLADLGARVIKIERPGDGDFARHYDTAVKGLASHFVWLNRSKESMTLDLKRPEARDVIGRLIARADVFVQNLAPGAAGRLGLDADTLLASHPRLIVCDVTGYGSSGPYRDRKAYDLLVQSEAGLLSITGTEGTPSKAGISVADIAAAMYAFSSILTALLAREKTGTGRAIEVSLFEALADWMGYPAYYTAYGGSAPRRTGASHAAIAPYGPFRSGDGKSVYLGIQNEREWEAFCGRVLERPDLAGDVRFDSVSARLQHREALEAEIDRVFEHLPAAQIIERLDRASIANARLSTMQEFWDHPQLAARHRWQTIDSPAGPLQALLPAATFSDIDAVMGPVPALGEHTDAILSELGIDEATRERWRNAGVI